MRFWDGSNISSRQITTPTLHHSLFTGLMLFPTPNQQYQNIEGKSTEGLMIDDETLLTMFVN